MFRRSRNSVSERSERRRCFGGAETRLATARRAGAAWSWRESNPRPLEGDNTRYDHSRVRGWAAASSPGRLGRSPAAGSFSDVSGLSRRQWSFPTVLHRFCCRAAVNRPRVALLLAMTLRYLTRSGGKSEIVLIGVSVVAPFKESEQLRSHDAASVSNVETDQPRVIQGCLSRIAPEGDLHSTAPSPKGAWHLQGSKVPGTSGPGLGRAGE